MTRFVKLLALVGSAVSLAGLSGCASAPRQDPYQLPPEAYATPPPPSSGSIFNHAQHVSLFADRKAHQIGDVLTVQLVERTDAQKSAATNTQKKTSVNLPAPTLFNSVINSVNSGLETDNSFNGSGGSSQSNTLTGAVTVIVTQVLPNGNLLVRGEKEIQINRGTEVVFIEGIVRPTDISFDNSVRSDRVANARIRYGGSGALADANTQGWLGRFFNSRWFPF